MWPATTVQTSNHYKIIGPAAHPSVQIRKIVRSAGVRWLSKQEVVDLFINCQKDELSLCNEVPDRPCSGTLIMYQRRTMARQMRKDGHEWVKKSASNRSTREDHKQLHHGVWVIACYYAHGRDINIHRRVYSLHKRVGGTSAGKKVTLAKHVFGLNLVHYLADDFTRVKASATKAASPAKQLCIKTDNKQLLHRSPWQGIAKLSDGDASSGAGDSNLLHSPRLGPCQDMLSLDDMNLSDNIDRFSPTTIDLKLVSSLTSVSPRTEARSAADFGTTSQLQNTEPRYLRTECHVTQPESLVSERSSLASFSSAHSGLPEIIAYSPRWALLEGGECMLVVVPAVFAAASDTKIVFGVQACPTQHIAPNVLSCLVPPRGTAGPVNVFLSQAKDYRPCSAPIEFEYRDLTPRGADTPLRLPNKVASRKRRHAPATSSVSRMRCNERATKIRFVEKLENVLENAKNLAQSPEHLALGSLLQQSANAMKPDSPASHHLPLLDDKALETLDEIELVQRSKDLVMQVVSEVNALGISADSLPEMDSLDEEGLSLLHYACLFNCTDFVLALLDHRADPSILSSSGQTPLQMATARGHTAIVEILQMHQVSHFSFGSDDDDLIGEVFNSLDEEENAESTAMQVEPVASSQPHRSSASGNASSQLTADEAEVRSETLQEKLLANAFASMSLHQKCALSLANDSATKGQKTLSGDFMRGLGPSSKAAAAKALCTSDGQSWSSVLSLMTDQERGIVLKEASVIQANVRAWLIKNNYRHIRDSILSLQAMSRGMLARKELRREQAAATKIKAGMKGFLARKEFKQLKTQATSVQPSWQARKSSNALAKKTILRKHLSAALVIQRAWLSKSKRKE